MEGMTCPSFFRGIAIVVPGLFNADQVSSLASLQRILFLSDVDTFTDNPSSISSPLIHPGLPRLNQKDIQQTLIRRQMVKDTLLAYANYNT